MLKTLDSLNPSGKRCLVRVDFNVPLSATGKEVLDDERVVATVPTISELSKKGAKQILMSHLGRPKGRVEKTLSIMAVKDRLSTLLNRDVVYLGMPTSSAKKASQNLKDGEVGILENLRFDEREESGDITLSEELSGFGDVYINDAFAASHRPHCSITGVSKFLEGFVGRLFEQEVAGIDKVVGDNSEPSCAILGGAKASDKILLVENLLKNFDKVLIGGGMSVIFACALGYSSGAHNPPKQEVLAAERLMRMGSIVLPDDVVVKDAHSEEVLEEDFEAISPNKLVCDNGRKTNQKYSSIVTGGVKRVLWNGPMGIFEDERFAMGTKAICDSLAQLPKTTNVLGGGGSTVSAVKQFGVRTVFSHLSTAGGAFLEYLEGNKLPGIKALESQKF